MLDTIRYGSLLLASREGGDIVSGERGLDLAKNVQRSDRIRARNAKFYDRGNGAVQGSFQITRQHATKAEAWGHLLDIAAALRGVTGSNDLTWEYSAQGVRSATFKDAAVSAASMRQRGLSTLITYTFAAGEITNSLS